MMYNITNTAATITATTAFRTVSSATDAPTVEVSSTVAGASTINATSSVMASNPVFPRSSVRMKYWLSPVAWTMASGWSARSRAALTLTVPGSPPSNRNVTVEPDVKSIPRFSPGVTSTAADRMTSTSEILRNIRRFPTMSIRRCLRRLVRPAGPGDPGHALARRGSGCFQASTLRPGGAIACWRKMR